MLSLWPNGKKSPLDSAQTGTMTLRAGNDTFFGTDYIVSAAPKYWKYQQPKAVIKKWF